MNIIFKPAVFNVGIFEDSFHYQLRFQIIFASCSEKHIDIPVVSDSKIMNKRLYIYYIFTFLGLLQDIDLLFLGYIVSCLTDISDIGRANVLMFITEALVILAVMVIMLFTIIGRS